MIYCNYLTKILRQLSQNASTKNSLKIQEKAENLGEKMEVLKKNKNT